MLQSKKGSTVNREHNPGILPVHNPIYLIEQTLHYNTILCNYVIMNPGTEMIAE